MGYNYAWDWINHPDQIESLRKLESTVSKGMVLHYKSEDPRAIDERRRYVNNVLRSAERWNLNKELREHVRTWTNFENGEYHLFVGKPTQRVAGRPTTVPKKLTEYELTYGPAVSGDTYVLDFNVVDGDSWTRAVGRIMALPATVLEAYMIFDTDPLPPDEYLTSVFTGWTIVQSAPKVHIRRGTPS